MKEEKRALLEAMNISPAVAAFCQKQEASVRAKFDEIEEANKTELQKASEKVSALQDELNAIKKANEIRELYNLIKPSINSDKSYYSLKGKNLS